jgi:hypothetical protein
MNVGRGEQLRHVRPLSQEANASVDSERTCRIPQLRLVGLLGRPLGTPGDPALPRGKIAQPSESFQQYGLSLPTLQAASGDDYYGFLGRTECFAGCCPSGFRV